MSEQRQLLDEMLSQAVCCVKELEPKLVPLMSSGQPNLATVERTIFEAVLRLGACWLGLVLTLKALSLAETVGTRRACGCGGVMRWVSQRSKTVLSVLGKVSYRRVYYHCEQCRSGEAIGDSHWGLKHTRTTAGVVQLVGYLSACHGFVETARQICRTLCWPQEWLSGKQVQRLAEPLGQRLGMMEAERVRDWWQKVTTARSGVEALEGRTALVEEGEPSTPIRRLYVQMDGITVRFRGKEGKGSDSWREVKVGAVFVAEMGQRVSRLAQGIAEVAKAQGQEVQKWVDRPQGLISYVAGRLLAAEFGIRVYSEAVRRGLERAEEVVILGDGAHWIWLLAEEHFPRAVQILDFWHASEWVWKVANAVWGQRSVRGKEWAEEQISENLIKGDATALVAAIGVLPPVPPPPGETRSIPEQAMVYFKNNAERMRYPEYRAKGLEIGSGTIESAAKRVVAQRCKQAGMRWSEDGLPTILNLRTLVLNERYDEALAALPKAG